MAKYILNPSYGDMSVVVLGSSVKSIKKAFKKHCGDVLEYPEGFPKEYIENINTFLEKDLKNIEEIDDDYSNTFNEDYSFQEAY